MNGFIRTIKFSDPFVLSIVEGLRKLRDVSGLSSIRRLHHLQKKPAVHEPMHCRFNS